MAGPSSDAGREDLAATRGWLVTIALEDRCSFPHKKIRTDSEIECSDSTSSQLAWMTQAAENAARLARIANDLDDVTNQIEVLRRARAAPRRQGSRSMASQTTEDANGATRPSISRDRSPMSAIPLPFLPMMHGRVKRDRTLMSMQDNPIVRHEDVRKAPCVHRMV